MNVEPGYTTTEFWLTVGSQMVIAITGILVAFGVPVTPAEKMAILAAIPVFATFGVACYTIARSWRKNTADSLRLTPGITQVQQ